MRRVRGIGTDGRSDAAEATIGEIPSGQEADDAHSVPDSARAMSREAWCGRQQTLKDPVRARQPALACARPDEMHSHWARQSPAPRVQLKGRTGVFIDCTRQLRALQRVQASQLRYDMGHALDHAPYEIRSR